MWNFMELGLFSYVFFHFFSKYLRQIPVPKVTRPKTWNEIKYMKNALLYIHTELENKVIFKQVIVIDHRCMSRGHPKFWYFCQYQIRYNL